jgi:hypothetical protein
VGGLLGVHLGRDTLSFMRWPSPCYSASQGLPSKSTTSWDAYADISRRRRGGRTTTPRQLTTDHRSTSADGGLALPTPELSARRAKPRVARVQHARHLAHPQPTAEGELRLVEPIPGLALPRQNQARSVNLVSAESELLTVAFGSRPVDRLLGAESAC